MIDIPAQQDRPLLVYDSLVAMQFEDSTQLNPILLASLNYIGSTISLVESTVATQFSS